jgi:hypothetical protein
MPRGKKWLTSPGLWGETVDALDASGAGPENLLKVRRTCANLGRIFYAQNQSL